MASAGELDSASSRKKVLIITYYWPPAAGPGVQRFVKFCKYLPEFGWDPLILTVKSGSYPSIDESLGENLPSDLPVFRTKTFEPFQVYNRLRGEKGKEIPVSLIGIKEDKRLIQRLSLYIRANWFVPDARKGWRKYAVAEAIKLIKAHNPDVIITTGPPQSTHLIGLDLKRRCRLPWLADLRDPWTNVFYNKFFPRTESTKRKDKSMEDSVLKNADFVTVVSSGLKKEFEDRSKGISVIYNGFDEEDFVESQSTKQEKFTLEYIGNLKPNQNASGLWETISELLAENASFKVDFKLVLTGNIDKFIEADLTQKYGLGGNLDIKRFVPHREAVEVMKKAGMLLFIVPEADNNHLIITGKLFEYLASRSAILAIGPVDGDAAQLLAEANKSGMIDYSHKDELKRQLLGAYEAWKNVDAQQVNSDAADLSKFSRKSLTANLAEVLNKLANG
ncbi:MAG TPA: glycosyl transferase family 1 [Flavobacteriales bacterium]|nr:glycosyl transferase family 1 [Flavobacteriales bacterium]